MILEELAKIKDSLGGSFASVNIQTKKGFVTITICDDEPEDVKEKPIEHSLICKTCGMPFKSENPRAKTCPDCKKKAQARAIAKYQSKKKISDTAQELVRLGDDNA